MPQIQHEVEVVDGDGEIAQGQMTLESDPVFKTLLWRFICKGVPDYLFYRQGLKFSEFLSKPRYFRALEYDSSLSNDKRWNWICGYRLFVSRRYRDVVIQLFRNPLPGRILGIRRPDGFVELLMFNRLRFSTLEFRNSVFTYPAWFNQALVSILKSITPIGFFNAVLTATMGGRRVTGLEVGSDQETETVWKSTEEICLIYDRSIDLAYECDAIHALPRMEVTEFPWACVEIDGQFISLRLIGSCSQGFVAVADSQLAQCIDFCFSFLHIWEHCCCIPLNRVLLIDANQQQTSDPTFSTTALRELRSDFNCGKIALDTAVAKSTFAKILEDFLLHHSSTVASDRGTSRGQDLQSQLKKTAADELS